jgi:uncharacterized membrane protein
MTWNISTIVAEVFYCIIGLIFIATGMKALKDESCAHRTTTALFWFILAFTFIAGPYLPKWIKCSEKKFHSISSFLKNC